MEDLQRYLTRDKQRLLRCRDPEAVHQRDITEARIRVLHCLWDPVVPGSMVKR